MWCVGLSMALSIKLLQGVEDQSSPDCGREEDVEDCIAPALSSSPVICESLKSVWLDNSLL